MGKKIKSCFFLTTLLLISVAASAVSSFGNDDLSRQMSNSRKGFEDLDSETDNEFSDYDVSPARKKEERHKPVKKELPVGKSAEKKIAKTRPMQKMASVQDRVIEKSGVKFYFTKCIKSEKELRCQLQIESRAFDRSIYLYPSDQRFVDNLGNEYKAIRAQVGSVQDTYRVVASLISDIKTNAYLSFQNISSEAENIAVLELGGIIKKDGVKSNFVVQYRKIEFSE